MTIDIYATFNFEKDIEKITHELNMIETSCTYSILSERDVVFDSPAARVNAAGPYPTPVLINDKYEFASLNDHERTLLKRHLDSGSAILYVESIENENLNHVLSLLRENATHVIKDNVGVGANLLAVQASDPAEILNHLIALCLDGVEGYRTAADLVENDVHKNLFIDYARQRENFAAQLSRLVLEMGEKPAQSSTWLGTLHQNWLKFRSALSSNEDSHTILSEALRGEEAVTEAYSDAFAGELPENARGVIRSQLTHIRLAYDRMKALESVAGG